MFNRLKKNKNNEEKATLALADGAVKSVSNEDIKAHFVDDITALYRQTGINQREFTQYFLPTVLSYLYFVQAIPATRYPAYDRLHGLADLTLKASINGIKIRNGMVLPSGARADLIDKQKSRWSYLVLISIFVNALRENINHCLVETGKGEDFKSWDFTKGALGDHDYCRFKKVPFDSPGLDSAAASLLTPRFINNETFKWLGEHDNVTCELMGIVTDNRAYRLNLQSFQTLQLVLPNMVATVSVNNESPDQATKKKKKKVKQAKKKKEKKSKTISPSGFESDFFQWLFNGFESNEMVVNTLESMCHVVEGGLFIDIDTVKNYGAAIAPDDANQNRQLQQEAKALLSGYEAKVFKAYGRKLKGHIVTPDLDFLSFTPINDELMLVEDKIDE